MPSRYAQDVAEIKQIVAGLPDQLGRIERKLEQINGEVDEHGQALARLEQWKEDREGVDATLRTRMDALGRRVWGLSGFNGLLSLVSYLLGR